MTDVEWRPLSERMGAVPGSPAWRADVPAALERPLRNWAADTLDLEGSDTLINHWRLVERVSLRLNVRIPDSDWAGRHLANQMNSKRLPDLADAILDVLASPAISGYDFNIDRVKKWSASLQELLDDARSALRVREDGRGLERRAEAAAEVAFGAAMESAEAASGAGSAAEHLQTAWGCVHQLRPDPGKAYGEAIKAVEAAAHSVVYPDGRLATLGMMLPYLREHPEEFSLVIGGRDRRGHVGRLIGCMELLWFGQTDRHGSTEPTPAVTLEEGTMAVHMAVMLVQWFTSGAVSRLAS
jgi:hypothetical protein